MTETKATPEELLAAHILNIWEEQDPSNAELVSTLTEQIGPCPVKLMEKVLENHDDGSLQDVMYGFRTDGGEATNLPTHNIFSRVYDVEIRAVKIQGKWVGWFHWYGGGEYMHPEDGPWIKDSFYVDLVEEKEITITKRTFAYKKDE